MKITNNSDIQFGSVIATEKAIKYMNSRFSPKQIKKANEIIAGQKGKKPNINLSLGSFQRVNYNQKMYYLVASVGKEIFKEGLFTGPFGVLKKSAEYVDSFTKKA